MRSPLLACRVDARSPRQPKRRQVWCLGGSGSLARMSDATARGAVAGTVAAAAWLAAEPALQRAFASPYSDLRLLGRLATRGRLWPLAGAAAHLANGALFGAVFARLGGSGPGAAILAAQAENAVLWPVMALVDRIHPDRRSSAWPPLLRNGRVLGQEVAAHLLFGAVLGALVREPRGGGPAAGL
jgi:hypothetical protein